MITETIVQFEKCNNDLHFLDNLLFGWCGSCAMKYEDHDCAGASCRACELTIGSI